jgi:hypothetical protein
MAGIHSSGVETSQPYLVILLDEHENPKLRLTSLSGVSDEQKERRRTQSELSSCEAIVRLSFVHKLRCGVFP